MIFKYKNIVFFITLECLHVPMAFDLLGTSSLAAWISFCGGGYPEDLICWSSNQYATVAECLFLWCSFIKKKNFLFYFK